VKIVARFREPQVCVACGAQEGDRRSIGQVMFDGLVLLTAPGRVMTPRSPSAQLVAAARPRLSKRSARVADVGTGSGAIACPNVEVWATDISHDAVALARANVRHHRLEDRVQVRHGDLLAPVPGPVDLIVANLPYIAASAAVEHPDLVSEPAVAVFADGDGLGPYRRLVEAAATRLADSGALLLQLDRRVVAASRAEFPALRAALSNAVSAAAA
jgi:release factor glutamine methyltransferase